MYDPTFGQATLARHLRKADFRQYPALNTPSVRDAEIATAVGISRAGLTAMHLLKSDLASREIYQVDGLPTELVLRKAAQNIRRITSARQSNRLDIVRRVRLLCEEGMPFSVAKFDITSFYSSIDQKTLKELIVRRFSTSPSTRLVLLSFIDRCAAIGISGLPPGLAISASLCEFYMQDFDQYASTAIGAHMFARYVDDIILLMPPVADARRLRKDISRALPNGLSLNSKKSRILVFGEEKEVAPIVEHEFDYLGFEFKVYQTKKKKPIIRRVDLDIATSKVKRRKTRLALSVLQFLKDGNFDDLKDRFRVIACNYRFYDHRKSTYRLAGARHAYGLIDQPSKALSELDLFQRKLVLQSKGKIGSQLAGRLTNLQKKELLRLTFTKGFENKTYFYFKPDRLKYLMDSWKYA